LQRNIRDKARIRPAIRAKIAGHHADIVRGVEAAVARR
jgi:hypothetical protein